MFKWNRQGWCIYLHLKSMTLVLRHWRRCLRKSRPPLAGGYTSSWSPYSPTSRGETSAQSLPVENKPQLIRVVKAPKNYPCSTTQRTNSGWSIEMCTCKAESWSSHQRQCLREFPLFFRPYGPLQSQCPWFVMRSLLYFDLTTITFRASRAWIRPASGRALRISPTRNLKEGRVDVRYHVIPADRLENISHTRIKPRGF